MDNALKHLGKYLYPDMDNALKHLGKPSYELLHLGKYFSPKLGNKILHLVNILPLGWVMYTCIWAKKISLSWLIFIAKAWY